MPEPEDTTPQSDPATASSPAAGVAEDTPDSASGIAPAQWKLIVFIVAFTAAAFLYRVLVHEHLSHTAAMFLGIPSVLAILLALTPKAKSLTGGIVKGMTFFLLIIAPLLGEGYLCILIASPIFYIVALLIGVILDTFRKRRQNKATLGCVTLLMIPMCLEGIVPQLTANREEAVEVTRVVNAPAATVEASLAQSPDLNSPLPMPLRIGFPRPLQAHGSGLEIGAVRSLHFTGAEGDPPGDLVSHVTEHRPGYIRTETVSDSSKLTQWLRWQSSEVTWHATDTRHTSVTWRIQFARQLDPAWYFIPLERIAVYYAARYMIEANATPHASDGALP